jgi:hypothetical protein
MASQLSLLPQEAEELQRCEAVIARGLETFVEVGTALLTIRDERLYRAEYGKFEDYCRARWGMSRVRAHQLIVAAEVARNLSVPPLEGAVLTTVNTPLANEAQARPLAALSPEQQLEAWHKAVETAPNGKVTAKHVEAVVEEFKEAKSADKPLPGQAELFVEADDDDSEEPQEAEEEHPKKPTVVTGTWFRPDEDEEADEDDEPEPTPTRAAPPSRPAPPGRNLPVVNLGAAPTFAPPPGKRSTACFNKWANDLNNIILEVREHGAIEGSVQGLTREERAFLLAHFERFQECLTNWILYLKESS